MFEPGQRVIIIRMEPWMGEIEKFVGQQARVLGCGRGFVDIRLLTGPYAALNYTWGIRPESLAQVKQCPMQEVSQ